MSPLQLPVREALKCGIKTLEAAHAPSAALGAELLLMHALDRDRAWIYAHPEEALTTEQSNRYHRLIAARASGKPAQYLTGKQEFWGLEFEVTPDVLIPRPETEHAVEVAVERLGPSRKLASLQIADIGTGSGCIAVALAKELRNATIWALDISPAALTVAKRNASRHQVLDRIRFIESNLLASAELPQGFDLIVSNPPYIAEGENSNLERDVRDHEPAIALFAGPEGLDVYGPLLIQAEQRLKPGGSIVLELGLGLFEPVSELFDVTRGWTHVSAAMDLAGIPRVIAATKL